MKVSKNSNEPVWGSQQRGKATDAFNRAVANKTLAPQSPLGGSQMVKNSAFGLHEGPTPPGLTRSAVTRQSFNRRWREEGRGFRALRFQLREQFNRKAGTIRNAVVQSETDTRLVKQDFNRAARPRRKL